MARTADFVALATTIWGRALGSHRGDARRIHAELDGVWEGRLEPSSPDPATGEQALPLPITIELRHRLFLGTTIELRVADRVAFTTRCLVEADATGRHLSFCHAYRNRPRSSHPGDGPGDVAMATMTLELNGSRARLFGSYYADRRTNGAVTLVRTSR